jgi:hypothetical protein
VIGVASSLRDWSVPLAPSRTEPSRADSESSPGNTRSITVSQEALSLPRRTGKLDYFAILQGSSLSLFALLVIFDVSSRADERHMGDDPELRAASFNFHLSFLLPSSKTDFYRLNHGLQSRRYSTRSQCTGNEDLIAVRCFSRRLRSQGN